MSMLDVYGDFFGLDMGPDGLRVVQLQGGGKDKLKSLVAYGHMPLDPKLALSEAGADQQKIAQALKQLVSDARIVTKNVAVGLPSQRVFTGVVDVDRLPMKELEQTINYQADTLIPTPIDESKFEWALLGDSPADKNKLEILVSSVTNEFSETRLDLLEGAGFNVIAFEPDTIALMRALVPDNITEPVLILDMDLKSTDLVIAKSGQPRLMRAIPTATEAIVKAASNNLSIDHAQATQFVFKFGLIKEKLEGQVRGAIIGTVDQLMGDVEKSINFYKTRYPNDPIARIIVTGGASSLPEFPLYLASKFNVNVEIGNAWRNVAFAPERQNELLAVSNTFSVAAGLAERGR